MRFRVYFMGNKKTGEGWVLVEADTKEEAKAKAKKELKRSDTILTVEEYERS